MGTFAPVCVHWAEREYPRKEKGVRYFDTSDEWIDVSGSKGTIGITPEGAAKLGEVTFVELPEVGNTVAQGDTLCTIESVKAAVDLFAPMSGTVTAVNTVLASEPHLLGERADETWIATVELTVPAEVTSLMDESAYKNFASEE